MSVKKILALTRLIHPICARRWCFTLKGPKPSYIFGTGSRRLTPATLGQILDQTVLEAGDEKGFVFPSQDITRTFYEFQTEVDKLASGLLALGLKKGDRVGICAPNVYEWPVTQFATAKAGLILVCINPASQAQELEFFINKVGCKALITSQAFKTQDYYKMLCSFIPELPSSKPGSLSSQAVPTLQSIILLNESTNSNKGGTFLYNDIMNSGCSKSKEALTEMQNLVQCDDPVHILFTSGTTGYPKGATLSHHSLVNNATIIGMRFRHHLQKSIMCIPLPFFHSFAAVCGIIESVIYKNTCVVPSPGFDAEACLRAIDKYRCVLTFGTPTMLIEKMNKYDPKTQDFSCLKQVCIGGAASTETMLRGLKETWKNLEYIHNGYGTTETSPGIATVVEPYPPDDTMSYMTAMDYTEIKIVDNNGRIVPIGSVGEVCARGHNIFLGYWDKDNYTRAVDAANWYRTGDLGKMDDQGRIRITGRIKDLVIRGGENVYPAEVENALNKHPSVLEVHVCGVPDVKMGEELCAWIMLKTGESLTEEDLKSYLKGKISHFKIPRYIMFVEDFPKTGTGKIQKFKMTELSKKQLNLE